MVVAQGYAKRERSPKRFPIENSADCPETVHVSLPEMHQHQIGSQLGRQVGTQAPIRGTASMSDFALSRDTS